MLKNNNTGLHSGLVLKIGRSTIAGNTAGIKGPSSGFKIFAQNNWWGKNTGANTTGADNFTGAVDVAKHRSGPAECTLVGVDCLKDPDAAPCTDGNACTVGDACKSGKCEAGAGCDANATCGSGGCACKTGFTGSGHTCEACKTPNFYHNNQCLPETTTKAVQFKLNNFCDNKQLITTTNVNLVIDKKPKTGGGYDVTIKGTFYARSHTYGHHRIELPVGLDPPATFDVQCKFQKYNGKVITVGVRLHGVDWKKFTKAMLFIPDKWNGNFEIECDWTTTDDSPLKTWSNKICVKDIVLEP